MLVTVTAKQDQTWKTIILNFASNDFDNESVFTSSDAAAYTAVAATTAAAVAFSLF